MKKKKKDVIEINIDLHQRPLVVVRWLRLEKINLHNSEFFNSVRNCRFDNSLWRGGYTWDDRLARTTEHKKICFLS